MHADDGVVFDDEHAHKLSWGRKWHRKLSSVTRCIPFGFHAGAKLRRKGVNDARAQTCPRSIFGRTWSLVRYRELQCISYLRAQTHSAGRANVLDDVRYQLIDDQGYGNGHVGGHVQPV